MYYFFREQWFSIGRILNMQVSVLYSWCDYYLIFCYLSTISRLFPLKRFIHDTDSGTRNPHSTWILLRQVFMTSLMSKDSEVNLHNISSTGVLMSSFLIHFTPLCDSVCIFWVFSKSSSSFMKPSRGAHLLPRHFRYVCVSLKAPIFVK